MNRLGLVLGLLGLVLSSGASGASAAQVSAGTDVVSAYVWRGMTFNDEAVVQPYLNVAAENGFGVSVWGNYDVGDYGGTLAQDNEFSEIDLTLTYGFSLGPAEMTVGHI
ncbi:MAG: TorF family putative porin, partial [Candidatus Zixiibacteriota bacterium]